MVVTEKIASTIRNGSGAFQHGHTYNGNPVTAAAVVATIQYMKKNRTIENGAERGRQFDGMIPEFLDIPIIGEVRGMGLMRGMEIVADRETKRPFSPSVKAAALVTEECMKRGLVIYPGTGQIGGVAGDQFLFAPPLVSTADELEEMKSRLLGGLNAAAEALKGKT